MTHTASIRRIAGVEEGQHDKATRYNMTAIIGLPDEAVDQMSDAPWWPGLVAAAPTLVYDHQVSHVLAGQDHGAAPEVIVPEPVKFLRSTG